MNRFEIEVSPHADDDLFATLRYIRVVHENPPAAQAVYDAYIRGLDRLRDFADGCPAAAEAHLVAFDLREGYFATRTGRTYRIVFALWEASVGVLRIRSQDQRTLRRRELAAAYQSLGGDPPTS